ncbi:acetoin utilization protein AcuB [Oikeobacillus pervagus]|uniref:Acetoin utilization protein AcuB n=1 Tax=Oikeobacillus pervagus TaxID=1325931 RepID=A0AAJ1SYB5_9BACI|nr:acetoin utilization AcuB family protein [Oikeobacillus pervagus]MDQ0215029.1 acetoin utilization protein AcuB [Oikeobacillus pervagus]
MIIEEIMKKDLITLQPDATIKTALHLLRTNKIRHIPVIDNNLKLIGLISDRDIKEAIPSILQKESQEDLLSKPIHLFMKKDVITGHPLDFVEDVAVIFYEHNIGCLPILNEDQLVGIVTETDVMRTFVELTGANQPGSRFEIKVPNKAGVLYEVVKIIKKRNSMIHSVLVYPDKSDDRYKILVFRVRTMNPVGTIDDLKKDGYMVLWPNMPGISS